MKIIFGRLRTLNMPLTGQALDNVLREYFCSWRPYKQIIERLWRVDRMKRSVSWLKLQFKRLGLSRRCRDPPRSILLTKIAGILRSSDSLGGYRSVWKVLRDKYNIIVRRDTVMRLLQVVDPEGVSQRAQKRLKRRTYYSKGTNYLWHVDGYDKLTPYGLTIHGCIDGFSRKILWLKVASSNSDPKVIVRYYADAVLKARGCPTLLRCDYGTENTSLASAHIAFRYYHTDSRAREKSFLYGPSKNNIRIEAWWSQLRRLKTDWWINVLKDLELDGFIDRSSGLHRKCIAYTFAKLLQRDLDSFKLYWNSHYIRKNNQSVSPCGIPNDLYDMPESKGGMNCTQNVDPTLLAMVRNEEGALSRPFYDDVFRIIADYILDVKLNGLTSNDITFDNCKHVYVTLLDELS